MLCHVVASEELLVHPPENLLQSEAGTADQEANNNMSLTTNRDEIFLPPGDALWLWQCLLLLGRVAPRFILRAPRRGMMFLLIRLD